MLEADEAISVTMVTTDAMTDAQRSAVIEVCVAAHDSEEFRNLYSYIRSGARHFIASRGAEIVSHAMVTTRWVQPADQRVLRTAYIDAVSTLPMYQHLGYSTATMSRLAAEISDYEIGCLQTDRHTFYERLGWELWRGPLAGRSDDGLIPTPEQRGVMVLRLEQTPPLDLDAQLSIECQPERIWE